MNTLYYVAGIPVSGDNCLKHYQIKGAHWGVRRFQNEDGSLTEAGRRRYGYTDSGSELRGLTPAASTNKSVNRPLTAEEKRGASAALDTSYQRRMLSGADDPMMSLPGYGLPGHKFRVISDDEYDRINAQNQNGSSNNAASVADSVLSTSLDAATPALVKASVKKGKTLTRKLKNKKVKRVIRTNSARTLNEETKNLTDLNGNNPYLRDYFEQPNRG